MPEDGARLDASVRAVLGCLGDQAGFIFRHQVRNPRFDNVTRRPGYSQGPTGFLPTSIEGMSFFIGWFLKEKGLWAFWAP